MANDPSPTTPPPSPLPLIRMRLALALVAAVGIALELALMRGLAIRFSSHFAGIVISVGLLGFGAAGSCLTLFRAAFLRHRRTILVLLALALAIAIPITWLLSQYVPLNVNFLAWNIREFPNVLKIELLMVIPFALAGTFIGIALMDTPRRINGHYASDLLGSGLGGIVAVLVMNILTIAQLLVALSFAALLAAVLLLQIKRPVQLTAAVFALVFTATILFWLPAEPTPNQYKGLTRVQNIASTREIYRDQGPLGRIDVVRGPELHTAPELSLNYLEEPPPHVEIYIDAAGPSLLYDCKTSDEWSFADYRTAAAPFQLLDAANICVIEAGGGVDIGTALFHHAANVTALELNPQIIRAMTGPLAHRGGGIYNAPGVHVLNQEARGFFAATSDSFDIIQLPPIGGFGAAGSDATQESYIYTTQSIRAMLRHLSPTGILSITRGIKPPPREELRAFDLAVQSLREENLDPAAHLAMIRGFFSSTVLAFKQPITSGQITALRAFCQKMSFDLCCLPGLQPSEITTSNVPLGDDPYFQGAQALLGPPAQREAFLAANLFNLQAPTDDQPYFFHFFRWNSYPLLREKTGHDPHDFLEVSYVMLLTGLGQAVFLAGILILLPLAPGIKSLRQARGKTACLGYFLMLGLGFMLLEMSFVQKLVLYLAHPIYAAAVAIASFLVFAGVGSEISRAWPGGPGKTAPIAAILAAALGLLYLLGLDNWLALTQSWDVAARCLVAAGTIAPLAFAMGHLFPLGLRRVADSQPVLVPWSWAINGFASVVATAAAPLLAMRFGFSHVIIVAILCYLFAALLFHWIPAALPKVNASSPS